MQLIALGVHFELHPLGFVLLNGRGDKLLHGVGVEILLQVLFAAGGQGEHHGQGQAGGHGKGQNAFFHLVFSSHSDDMAMQISCTVPEGRHPKADAAVGTCILGELNRVRRGGGGSGDRTAYKEIILLTV